MGGTKFICTKVDVSRVTSNAQNTYETNFFCGYLALGWHPKARDSQEQVLFRKLDLLFVDYCSALVFYFLTGKSAPPPDQR